MNRPMRTSLVGAALFAALALAGRSSDAQPAPAQTPETPPPAAEGAPPKPAALDVQDPDLAPIPPAARTLASWQEAMDLVLARSPDLRVAEGEVRRAEGISRQALAGVLPRVTATGSVSKQLIQGETSVPQYAVDIASLSLVQTGSITTDIPNPTVAVGQLTAAWPLSPRAYYGLDTAELGISAATRSFEDKRRTVIAAVASSIVALVTAERVGEISRVGLRSSLERLELMQRRTRLGSGTALDVLRAEQDVTLARATLVNANESIRKAREGLGLALGSSEPFGVVPTVSLAAVEQSARSICTPGRPEDRADVAAARVQRQIAERGVTDAKLLYAPTAELSTTGTVSSEALSNAKQYTWSVQAVLTIPIFDGGSRYGAAKSARASADQQAELSDAALRRATIEASQALRGVEVAEQARALSQKTAELTRETERLSKVAYEAGAGTSFELVDAARRTREADLDLAVKEFQLVSARITALLATANCAL